MVETIGTGPKDRKRRPRKEKKMFVNEFKVGDRISLYGWPGKVAEITHINREGTPCTYLRVNFDNPTEVGYQYEGGWYGGADNVVAYGYIE